MKFAYVGIDLYSSALEALLSQKQEILKVFTCETDNITEFNQHVIQLARMNNIPYTLKRISKQDILNLIEEGCECLICAGYYYRLPIAEDFLMLNIHPSLLPIGKGAWPMPWTILKGLSSSGVTIHKMVDSFDDGEIVLQQEIPLSENEDLQSLMKKQNELIPQLIYSLLKNFDFLIEHAKPQEEGEYWRKIEESDFPITADMPIKEADLILRAFYGYECIYIKNQEQYAVYKGFVGKEKTSDGLPLLDGEIQAKRIRKL